MAKHVKTLLPFIFAKIKPYTITLDGKPTLIENEYFFGYRDFDKDEFVGTLWQRENGKIYGGNAACYSVKEFSDAIEKEILLGEE